MANISTIKVGSTSYGITPASHASTATTYGAASASNYGHVKLSDNYTSSAGAAASGIGASSAAVYNAYNTLNSNLTKGVEYLLIGEEEEAISVLANNTTSLGTINIPPNSVCVLTVRVNNRTYNPTFKLGLAGDLNNPYAVCWGERHIDAEIYETFASTITIINGLSTEQLLYVVINSNIDMGVCYVFVTGIIAPIL